MLTRPCNLYDVSLIYAERHGDVYCIKASDVHGNVWVYSRWFNVYDSNDVIFMDDIMKAYHEVMRVNDLHWIREDSTEVDDRTLTTDEWYLMGIVGVLGFTVGVWSALIIHVLGW